MTNSEARKALTKVQAKGFSGIVSKRAGAAFVIVRQYGQTVTELWEENDVDSFVGAS